MSNTRCVQGILDRYSQIRPKFVIAETEVQYAGKVIDLLPKVRQVVSSLAGQGLQKAILLPSRVSGKILALPDIPITYVNSQFFHGLRKSMCLFVLVGLRW